MADQEKQQITELDTPKPGGSRTGRAVALARLLHHECCGLLQLYIERETFLSDHTPDGGRIVSLSQDSDEPSTEEQVQLLHSALRQCLGLLHCLILKEEKEWGELEGDYETMRKNVRFRLEYLLHSTKDLVEGTTLDVTPDHMFNEPGPNTGEKDQELSESEVLWRFFCKRLEEVHQHSSVITFVEGWQPRNLFSEMGTGQKA